MTKQDSSSSDSGSDIGLVAILSTIPDPRRQHRRLHKLEDVLTIAMCTVLCGHAEFTEMEAFGELREDWLRGFLELPNGIPSHDTFRNVFAAIEPARFLEAFALWTRGVRGRCGGGVVAFDGKALRGTKGGEADMRTVVGADYLLALKGNQGLLHAQVAEYLDGLIAEGWEPRVTETSAGRGQVTRARTSPR